LETARTLLEAGAKPGELRSSVCSNKFKDGKIPTVAKASAKHGNVAASLKTTANSKEHYVPLHAAAK
jgi:hypothetical protein